MKVSFVLFVLCLTASCSALEKKFPTARIFGGQIASPGQFPWYALVLTQYYYDPVTYICGGALISPKWILTAAHCIVQEGKIIFRVEVKLGIIYRLQKTKTKFVPKRLILHPYYDGLRNDIALIELPGNVKFSDRISSIPIISKQVPNGKNLTMIGFGKTEFGYFSQYLLYVDVNKVDRSECVKHFLPLLPGRILPEKIICCKGKGVKDSCNGDSGGPLIAYEGGQPLLVGVVSIGNQCGFGTPKIYTSALAYIPWINNNINNSLNPEDTRVI